MMNKSRTISSGHHGHGQHGGHQQRLKPTTAERSLSSSADTTSLRSSNLTLTRREIISSARSSVPSARTNVSSSGRRSQHHHQQSKKKMPSSGGISRDTVSSATRRRSAEQKSNQPSLTATGMLRSQTYTISPASQTTSSSRPSSMTPQQRIPSGRNRPSSTTASKRNQRVSPRESWNNNFDRPTSHLGLSFNSSGRLHSAKSKPEPERKHWFELPNPILPKIPPKGSCLSTIVETSNHSLLSPSRSSNPQMSALLTSIATIWRKKQLFDVVLAIGPHRLGAHKIILAASSEYFYELFTREEDNQEEEQFMYTLKGISLETMRLLLESMYTCNLVVTSENVERILNTATYLRIPSALESCSNFLIKNLNVTSCLVTIALAQVFELGEVAEIACKLAAKNFVKITEMDEFLELTESMLMMLLRRDDLEVDSELQVFEALLRWIDADREQRLIHAETLLENIRLPLIRPPDLVDHVESVDFLMGIPPCEALVKEALHYHCLPQRQAVLQSCRTTPRSSVKTTTLVALGGHPRRSKDPVSSSVEYYNPTERNWKTLTHMKQPRHHHAVACLGGFLYLAGGRTTAQTNAYPLRTMYRYDPRTDSWLRVADMINARESFQLAVLDGKIYAVGGRVDDQCSLADVERYNSNKDEWEEVSPLSDARRGVAVATHDGKLYAIGGSGNRKIFCKVERYNPHTDTWEPRRPLTTPRFFALLSSVGENLYLAGGATLDNDTGEVRCVPNIERYNPRTDTWSVLKPMGEPRAEAASCVLGKRIYVIGGYSWDTKAYLQSVECYDTEEDEWSELEMFPKAYTGIACCAMTLHKLP